MVGSMIVNLPEGASAVTDNSDTSYYFVPAYTAQAATGTWYLQGVKVEAAE